MGRVAQGSNPFLVHVNMDGLNEHQSSSIYRKLMTCSYIFPSNVWPFCAGFPRSMLHPKMALEDKHWILGCTISGPIFIPTIGGERGLV